MVTLKSDSLLISQKWQLRSEATDSLPLALDRAIQAQQAKDTTTALVEYKNAIKAAALPLNQAAWLLHARGDQDNAYALARTAMFVSPADADIQDTYAEILLSKGDYYQALEHAKKAAEFNQKYAVKIKKYREAYEKFSKE